MVMIRNKLLSNIFFGSELEKLEKGALTTTEILKETDPAFKALPEKEWVRVNDIVKGFFSGNLKGRFGGPITAGDAFFIAAYMSAFRPKSMIEVGVCSGVSSAFILYAAHKLGLAKDGKIFLQSIDLLRLHGEAQHEVGRVVGMNYPSLAQYWELTVEVTAPTVALQHESLRKKIEAGTPTLAFIDANHMHPWPVVDVMSIAKMLPKDSWILMQDTQVMERWLANSVELGVPTPKPCRGVNLALSLWPGSKAMGWDMCYNMGALKLDVNSKQIAHYVDNTMTYPSETGQAQMVECQGYLKALTA